jgi:hypothetical protein
MADPIRPLRQRDTNPELLEDIADSIAQAVHKNLAPPWVVVAEALWPVSFAAREVAERLRDPDDLVELAKLALVDLRSVVAAVGERRLLRRVIEDLSEVDKEVEK